MSEELTFGSWLRQRRKELSITQEELAEVLDISWITLRKLEAGERRPSGQIALLLADYLRLPTDERHAFVAFARTGGTGSGDAKPSAPWRSALVRQTNLPTVLTSLIGREREEAAALDHLLNPRTRLLTLIGAPGIGKTRLGLQLASALLAHFEDGIFFVDLAPVMKPEMVLPTIARTLGLKESAEQPLESVLLGYLRQRRMLLVLDNFEQVLDASTEVVKLVEASPWLKMLITSREALQVRGERRFFVPPLAVPDLRHPPSLEELADYSSVELFVERAQAVAPDFTLVDANALDVAAVCVGLEGLPLAIELAASRANWLPPAEMRAALTSRLKLLRAVTRGLPARQRTLRGAIEWSYGLLSSDEQTLFRRLGVFVGGFTPDAVHAVCRSADRDSEDSIAATVETLHSLVDKSLIQMRNVEFGMRSDSSASNIPHSEFHIPHSQEPRFGMLESIRDFVREKLEESRQPGEARDGVRKHALFFMTLAEEAELHLRGPRDQKWLGKLEDEHANLLAALSWAWTQSEDDYTGSEGRNTAGAVEIGLRSAVALRHFWYLRGFLDEGRAQLDAALAHSSSPGSSPGYSWSKTEEELQLARAKALDGAANLASQLGDYAAANAQRHESLATSKKFNDKKGIASTLNNMGVSADDQGEYASARAFLEESLAISREIGNKQGVAMALTNLGLVVFKQVEYVYARALQEESLALWEEVGSRSGIGLCLTNLGLVLYAQEKYDEARALCQEAMTIQRDIGNRWGVATLLSYLGQVSFMLNDYTSARALFEQSGVMFREIGNKLGIAQSLHNLAQLTLAQGEPEFARALFRESLALQWGMNDRVDIARNLAGLGTGAAAAAATMQAGVEETLRGARLLGAADALKEKLGVIWWPIDRVIFERGVMAARDRLGEEAFQRAFAEGRAMPLEETITYALQDIEGMLSDPAR